MVSRLMGIVTEWCTQIRRWELASLFTIAPVSTGTFLLIRFEILAVASN